MRSPHSEPIECPRERAMALIGCHQGHAREENECGCKKVRVHGGLGPVPKRMTGDDAGKSGTAAIRQARHGEPSPGPANKQAVEMNTEATWAHARYHQSACKYPLQTGT